MNYFSLYTVIVNLDDGELLEWWTLLVLGLSEAFY
jgi:hypothetical protein